MIEVLKNEAQVGPPPQIGPTCAEIRFQVGSNPKQAPQVGMTIRDPNFPKSTMPMSESECNRETKIRIPKSELEFNWETDIRTPKSESECN